MNIVTPEIIDAIKALHPPAWVVVSSNDIKKIHWNDGNPTEITTEQIKAKLAELQAAFPLQELREKRNQLLVSSDWTGLSDSALTNEQAAEWKLYRQRLRDFPSGLNTPAKVKAAKWPVKPV